MKIKTKNKKQLKKNRWYDVMDLNVRDSRKQDA